MALVAALVALACACSRAPRPTKSLFAEGLPVRSDDPKWADYRLNTVRVIDDNLKLWMQIEYAGSQFVRDGRMMAYAVARNDSPTPTLIEARAHFFDRRQAPIEEGEGWVRVVLGPKAITPFRILSETRRDPAYFVIEIRAAQVEP